MTKVSFFLGDDTEPFILKQPLKATKKIEQDDKIKKIIRKRKPKKCYNLLICFYGFFN